jgi:hypothetical protein
MSQMNPLDTMEQHVNMLGVIAKEFDAVGVRVLNEVKVMVLFINSPKSSQHFITALESLKPADHT